MSDVNNCRQAIAFTLEKFSQIDILVNAAGLTDRGNIIETSEELFDKMIGTNVKGPFFLIQDTVKDMIKKEVKGSIINIGSQAALTGQPFLASYSISKGALATLTKNTAFALLNNNIRVGFYLIITRKLSTSDNPLLTLLLTGAVGLVIISVLMPFIWDNLQVHVDIVLDQEVHPEYGELHSSSHQKNH